MCAGTGWRLAARGPARVGPRAGNPVQGFSARFLRRLLLLLLLSTQVHHPEGALPERHAGEGHDGHAFFFLSARCRASTVSEIAQRQDKLPERRIPYCGRKGESRGFRQEKKSDS